ncbi:MAG: hypothetical protein IJ542_03125 [Clostridia bacterium]|nr:hypothetical protein [Clostridia bacterium]
MEDFLKCGIVCLGIGMVIGGIIVAKNKKMATQIDEGTDKIAEKFEEVKDSAKEKFEEMKQKNKKQTKAKN